MPYELYISANEKLLTDVFYQPSPKSYPFRLVITNESFYLPAKRLVLVGDPFYLETVSVTKIKQVKIEPIPPYGFWLLSVLMVGIGITLLYCFFGEGQAFTPKLFGWTLALVVGGLLIPYAVRDRYRLAIKKEDKWFRWTPPLVVDPKSKLEIHDILDKVVYSARTLGIPTEDPRKPNQ